MTFAHLAWLVLLPIVPLVVFWLRRRRARPALRFPSAALARGTPRTLSLRLAWLPTSLRAACLAALVLALARPVQPNQATKVYAEGIAIEMLVDTSGSMMISDFELNGRPASRLDAVKDVFRRFVLGDGRMDGRPNDLVGLVTFANYPDVRCPLTLSHEALEHEIDAVRAALPSDDGTNIGDAVAWTLEDLKGAKAKSRVMILLTDGVNQPALAQGIQDPLDPLDAARIARGLGVKIYTIGAGSRGGSLRDPGSGRLLQALPVDEELLRRMAESTGGTYYRATDTPGLRAIYADIDRLEKTRSESETYLDYRELFAPLAFAALGLLGVEQLLGATRLRRIP